MAPTESHELTELVADLAVVAEVVAPPRAPGLATIAPPQVVTALGAFEDSWQRADTQRSRGLGALGERVAAAGMAFLEGDATTARRLVSAVPDAPDATGAE